MISLVRPENIALTYPTKIRVASFLYSYLPHLSLYDITLLTGTIAYLMGWWGMHIRSSFSHKEIRQQWADQKVFCNINQSGLMGTKSEICQNCTEHLTRRLNPISSFFTDGELYSGTTADFSGSDALIYRTDVRTEQNDLRHLNGKPFREHFFPELFTSDKYFYAPYLFYVKVYHLSTQIGRAEYL